MDKDLLRLLFLVSVIFLLGCYTGSKVRQDKIEKRALETDDKDTYTWQEIEIIIHGEIQQ